MLLKEHYIIMKMIEIISEEEKDRYIYRIKKLLDLKRQKQRKNAAKRYSQTPEIANFCKIEELTDKLEDLFHFYDKDSEQLNIYCEGLEIDHEYSGRINVPDLARELGIKIKSIKQHQQEIEAILYIDEKGNPNIGVKQNNSINEYDKLIAYEISRYLLTPIRFTQGVKMSVIHIYEKEQKGIMHELSCKYANDIIMPKEYFKKVYNIHKNKLSDEYIFREILNIDSKTYEERKAEIEEKGQGYTK